MTTTEKTLTFVTLQRWPLSNTQIVFKGATLTFTLKCGKKISHEHKAEWDLNHVRF